MHKSLVKQLEATMGGSPFLAHTLPHHEAKPSDDAVDLWRQKLEPVLRKQCDYLSPDERERISHYLAREVLAEVVTQLTEALVERDEARARATACEARQDETQSRMRRFQEGLSPLLAHLLPID